MSKLISNINKTLDNFKFDKHRKFRKIIYKDLKNNDVEKYDYGNGYFYQSLDKINLSGLRSSKNRLKEYDISKYTKNSDILDIGCNSAFLICELEQNFNSCFGIEWNKNLIEIGKKSIKYLDLKKIEIVHGDFLEHNFKDLFFDVIFSFANHSTYDKGIISTEKYFKKCNFLLRDKGKLIIESHHPNYEKKQTFLDLIDSLRKMYNLKIVLNKTIKTKSFYDNNREFIILQK